MKITIYHNPSCGSSRNALFAIRAAGHLPRIVDYQKTPLSRDELAALIARMDVPVRSVMRPTEPVFRELGLDEAGDDALLDAMAKHPILLNRPIVVVESGARWAGRLCRPSETVKEMLAAALAA
jgi:arsenate reductase (glutaredoxin)